MTITVNPQLQLDDSSRPVGAGGLAKILAKSGQFPILALVVKPLANANGDEDTAVTNQLSVDGKPLTKFLNYSFQSSIIVPVDSFSFSFASPDAAPITDSINAGDIVQLTANGITLATGIIDQVEVEIDGDSGEKITLQGRDLMSQLEDQDAISMDSSTIWGESTSLLNGVKTLCKDTRITNFEVKGKTPTGNSFLLATEPGESKLAALQRFLEYLNCVAWMAPNGTMNIGKPNMAQEITDNYFVSRADRDSNCLSMRVTRSPTMIPNIIIPVWTGQETTVNRADPQQALTNVGAKDANRLLKLGHRTLKTVIVSLPQGNDAQSLAEIDLLVQAGGANIIQAYAKKEIARKNVSELQVQVVVAGHFADDGSPFSIDTLYQISNDRAGIDEVMYLYQLEYTLDESGGQRTNLMFCRLGTIVADIVVTEGGDE